MDEQGRAGFNVKAVGIAVAVMAVILIFGTLWMGQHAREATENAVRSVSMFYLDELTGHLSKPVEPDVLFETLESLI